MGLLSFLSKQPPGTYPVAGNGPNTLKKLSRARDTANGSQLSLNFSTPSRIPPAPVVPRSRDVSLDRPKTAPIRSDHSSRPSNGSSRGRPPPLSFKMGRKSSLASESTYGHPDAKVTSSPRVGSGLRPRLLGVSGPGSSVRSDSLKGAKDILDAQSEFKPLDFRTRVKAAGARDYGEDVADRNIGQNGVNLESAQVQEFYAQSTADLSAQRSRCASMADISLQYLDEDTRGRSRSKQPATSSGFRAKSLNASSHYPFNQNTTLPALRLPSSILPDDCSILASGPSTATKVDRRQSLTSYIPTGPIETSKPRLMRRSLSLQRAEPPRTSSLVSAHDQADLHESRCGSLSTVRQLPIQKKPWGNNVPARRESDHQDADPNLDDPFANRTSPRGRSFSLTSASLRGSVGSVPSGHALRSPHGRRHAIQSPVSSVTSRGTVVDDSGITYSRDRSRFRGTHSDDIDASTPIATGTSALDSVSLWAPLTSKKEQGNTGVSRTHERTSSLASSLRTLKLDEISSIIPIRTASIRNWSISSTTPTTSDTSSNPSQRPQSRHTADTSVDLSNSFSAKNSSRGSLVSAIGPNSVAAASPKTAKSATFNIDDYISSDDDFMSPRRPRGEDEEDLLFRDGGYGMDGSFLPGLSGGMPLPGLGSGPQHHFPRPRTSSSLPSGHLHHAYSSPTFSPTFSSTFRPVSPSRSRQSRRYILDTAAHYDDDVDGDEDYIYHGGRDEQPLPGLSPRRSGGSGPRGTMRFTALGRMYEAPRPSSSSSSYQYPYHHRHRAGGSDDVIEEERDMSKIDIGAAVRMRKEAKARKRADAAAARMRRSSRNRVRGSLAGLDADDGHHADTEC